MLPGQVRDARLKRLKKLREDKKHESFDALAAALRADFPAHLPLLEEIMSRWWVCRLAVMLSRSRKLPWATWTGCYRKGGMLGL